MKTNLIYALIATVMLGSCSKNSTNNIDPIKPLAVTALAVGTAPAIKTFIFEDFNPHVHSTISAANNISFLLPAGTDPTQLSPTITLTSAGSVRPKTLTVENFSKPVVYYTKSTNGIDSVKYTAQATRPAASAKDAPVPPLKLCIYYGYPSLVKLNNGSTGTIAQAVSAFANFDVIVFGDSIEGNHPDHANTVQIISGLKSAKPAVKIYGYVDLGVNNGTHNNTATVYKQQIDQWRQMGVDGIFGDDFGGDFGVTRARQNDFITYIHNAKLSVFANSFYVGDALDHSSELGSKDYYLYEPLLVSTGSYTSFDFYKKKADSTYFFMKTTGVKIAAVSTIPSAQLNTSSNTTDKFTLGWFGASLFNFDAFQFTDSYYSASNNVLYNYVNPITTYNGAKWQQYDWVTKVSGVEYTRSYGTGTLHIRGNSSTTGRGYVSH